MPLSPQGDEGANITGMKMRLSKIREATEPLEYYLTHSNYHKGFADHDLGLPHATPSPEQEPRTLKTTVRLSAVPKTTRRMKLKLVTTPKVAVPGDRLRSHLQSWLERLPGKLPSYDRKQLLDDLCFLLRSPLFLYAIAPRVRRAITPSEGDVLDHMTPESLANGLKKAEDINIYALNMTIDWDGDSWATQLLYGNSSLMEGRQYKTMEKAGFTRSFHWFCDEARFLSYEFHARKHAAMVALSTAVDREAADVEVGQTRARTEGQKQRRIVKLKIRYKMGYGGPVLTKRAK